MKAIMKTMKYFLSMAALALVGAMTVSCSSDDNIIDQAQQPATNAGNVEILTTTVSLGGDGATRALTSTGVKTFAEGETMAIYYWKNKGNDHVKAVSAPLTAGNITNGGKSATFTFTLDNPYKNMSVSYVYPAAMANADFTPNYDALYNNQDGTLATLASNFDFCTRSGAWSGDNLPSVTLVNQLAILAINLKNSTGASDITGDITGMTISDGTNTYAVSRSAAAGPIYVAIRPTSDATITVTATDGTKNYTKTLTSKTYEAGNGYPVSWKMAKLTDLSSISGTEYTVQDGEVLTGTLASNVKISIADGATVTLKDVNITNLGNNCNWAGINCPDDATLVLEGTNTVCAGRDGSGYNNYPGIYIAPDKTLTIQGDGTLTAYSVASYPYGAGIGGGYDNACGNIVINGGTITAMGGQNSAGIGGGSNASCGNITINGGTVTATGGESGAGIGGGYASCGNITINGGTVTATGGANAAGIGGGENVSCGNITISGGTVEATGGELAAGIGGGCNNPVCGTITITSGVTSVTATKGPGASNSIGAGNGGTAITVNIEAGANVTQN